MLFHPRDCKKLYHSHGNDKKYFSFCCPSPGRCPAAAPRRHLFTLHFSLLPFSLARHRLVFLSVFRPPPLLLRGEEEERPGVEEKKRLWCKLSQYRASIDAPLQGGNCSAVWCRADLLQHPRPLPLTRRLQSLAGFPRAPGERQRKEKGGAS